MPFMSFYSKGGHCFYGISIKAIIWVYTFGLSVGLMPGFDAV